MTKQAIIPIVILFGLIVACAIIFLPKQNQTIEQEAIISSSDNISVSIDNTDDYEQENKTRINNEEDTAINKESNDFLVIGEKSVKNTITTISPIEYLNPESLQVNIPSFYNKLDIPGINYNIYAYMDKKGRVQCRAYGTKWIMENNVKKESITGFYKQNIELINGNVTVIDSGDKDPIADTQKNALDPDRKAKEGLNLSELYQELKQNLYLCCNNEYQVGYRTWCLVNDEYLLFPCDSKGIVSIGSIPVCYEEETYTLVDSANDSGSDYINRYPGIINNNIVLPVC